MPRGYLERALLAVLLAAHVLLGIYYSVTIPIWEAHDEIGHYHFVRYVATHGALPPPGTTLVDQNDESRQPPLYYILAALPVALVRGGDELDTHLNPHMAWPDGQGGVNRAVHDPAAEGWPYQGTTLAIHIARWVSVALGACALLFTFLAARQAFRRQPWVAWGAVLILALWPQFRFSTAVVNNDIMAVTAASAMAYVLARAIMAPKPRAADVLAVTVAAGLALLAKNTTLPLLPIAALVLAGCLLRSDKATRRRLLVWLGIGAVAALGLVGWWYVRNVAAGSGMFGGGYSLGIARTILTQAVTNAGAIRWSLAPRALQSGLFSLWAAFGWNNVSLPVGFYAAAAAWAALGGVGLVLWYLRRPQRAQVAAVSTLALIAVCTAAGFLLFTISGGRTDLPGRYLLPTLPALSILLAVGWHALLPGALRAPGFGAIAAAMAALVVITPAHYIAPKYALPVEISDAEAQAYTPMHATWGGFAELVGYRVSERSIDADGTLHVRLVWRALAQSDADYSMALQVFGPDRRLLGEVQTFPGKGTLATTTWRPGSLFTQDVAVRVDSDNKEPQLAWVELSFFDHLDVTKPVLAYDEDGKLVGAGATLSWVKIRGKGAAQAAEGPYDLYFGEVIRLAQCEASLAGPAEAPELALNLLWAATSQPDKDYTVSLQLRDEGNKIVSQVDTQPQEGLLPTSFWEAGEAIKDHYALALPPDLPAGNYTLYLCMYHLPTLQRLPLSGTQGQPLANDEVALLDLSAAAGGKAQVHPLYPLVQVAASSAD